jgi:hypothetical protein
MSSPPPSPASTRDSQASSYTVYGEQVHLKQRELYDNLHKQGPVSFSRGLYNAIQVSAVDVALDSITDIVQNVDLINNFARKLLSPDPYERLTVKKTYQKLEACFGNIARIPMTVAVAPVKLAYQIYITTFYSEIAVPWRDGDDEFKLSVTKYFDQAQKGLYIYFCKVIGGTPNIKERFLAIPVSIIDIGLDVLRLPIQTVECAFRSVLHLLAAPFSSEHTVKKSIKFAYMALSRLAITPVAADFAKFKIVYQIFYTFLTPQYSKCWRNES